MLKKIDCVMIKVGDPSTAAPYYQRLFGLRPTWQDENSIGLKLPEGDPGTEIVLHRIATIPSPIDVNYLVDDVLRAVRHFRENGCTIKVEPFDIPIGKCAVIKDANGLVWSILDMTKGRREPNYDAQARSETESR
jgi:lactoylglutathione lyase